MCFSVCVFETGRLDLAMPTCPLMLHGCALSAPSAELYKMPTMDPLCPVLNLFTKPSLFYIESWLKYTMHRNTPFHLENIALQFHVGKSSQTDLEVCEVQFSQL